MVQSIELARRRNTDTRVPPHNTDAEESLLGAMLLSRDAITAAVEAHVSPEDFYKPAHAHVYEAAMSLYGRGEAVDPITISEELRRANLLEPLGGSQALLRIQAATPASVNAMHYARIVTELALLRRLIGVAGEIAEMGYEVPDDVAATLDRAETLVFEVAERQVTDSLVVLHESLQHTLDDLEAMYGKDHHITGVPSGYYDLDDLLLGFQDSQLIIVAARPAMGKSSFALGAAAHVAMETKKPVMYFSMEMGSMELTKRLLAGEARVDARRLWTGNIPETDWTKLSHAVGRLAEAPLFIDDNARCTVMEMRAKARRIRARHGDLGLIVVDYIQLMSSSDRIENRQQEVSDLSRGLKILARELDTPVLALSQLNRQLEYRQDKRPMLADLRESGCLTADTLITRADTNENVTIGELFDADARNIPVYTLDDNLKLATGTMTHVFSSGIKEAFRVKLASGREVKASANHPFLTIAPAGFHVSVEWTSLEMLKVGMHIAAAVPGDAGVSLPPEVWEHVRHRVIFGIESTEAEFSRRIGIPGFGPDLPNGYISRPLAIEIGERTGSENLVQLADSDVFWDEIVSIESLGEEEVFDATVPGTHNFLANGIVVHNSLEQDSDVVAFLYRDEVYNPESDQRGVTEVIVAKHRNGPTGTVRLAFLDHLTKFANMARD